MAGLYIKGMEMPKNEYSYIEIQIWGDGLVATREGTRLIWGKSAIEVPDHGDLIDRDELMKKHRSWFYEGDEVCESIKAATVVIPAERDVKVCPLHSDDEVTEYCVEGPCTDEMESRCPIAERNEE